MTVIAYRDGIMAADDAAWDDTGHVVGTVQKIARLLDGGLLACMGEGPAIRKAAAWIAAGADPETRPALKDNSFACIWAKPDGTVARMTEELVDQEASSPFYALSCKAGFTKGALYAGASAEDAVRLTLEYTDAGGGSRAVQVERLHHGDQPAFLRAVSL